MPATPYSTGTDTGSGMIEALLSRLMGPEMSQMLSGVIANAIGKANINLPGGGALGAGNNSLFGPMNAGMGVLNSFQRNMLDRMTEGARKSDAEARMSFRQHFYSTVMGMAPAAAQHHSANSFVMNKGIDMMFSSDRAKSRAGLVIAGQHMGAAAVGFGNFGMQGAARDDQVRINAQVTKAIDTISSDFEQNRGLFGGATSAQFGGIVRDMARTGEIHRGMGVTDMQEAVRTGVRASMGFGAAVGANPLQARDFMNATTSMHMVGALGGTRAEKLAFRMQAAQMMSGVGPNVFQSLAAPLVQMQMQLGLQVPAHENAAIMMQTAGILAPASQMPGGTSGFFTNEASMREGVLRTVFSQSQSERARMITGAMSILKGQGADDTALRAFRSKLGGGDITAGSIAAAAGLQGVGAETLLAAGNTNEAIRFRAEGAGVTEATADHANRAVRALSREARGIIGGEGMLGAKGKRVSTDTIMRAFEKNAGDIEKTFNELGIQGGPERARAEGQIMTITGDLAGTLGFKSAHELTAFTARMTPEARAQREEREGMITRIHDATKTLGKVSGIDALKGAVSAADAEKGLTLEGVVEAMTSGDEATSKILTGMFGRDDMPQIVKKLADSKQVGTRRGAKLLGDLMSGTVTLDSLGKAGSARRKLVDKLQKGDLTQDEFLEQTQNLGNLQRTQDVFEGGALDVLAGSAITDVMFKSFVDKEGKFDKTGAEKFQKNLQQVQKVMTDKGITQEEAFKQVFKDDEQGRRNAVERLQQESEENAAVQNRGKTGLGGNNVIEDILGRILELIKTGIRST